jgi:CubicO group peptidase (beta-lactamase class C family)
MIRILVVAAIGLVVASASASAQTVTSSKYDLSSIRCDVQKDVNAGAVPGLAIAVAKDGKVLWQEGFGWANVEKRIPATENTAFYVASVTKSIAATAILQLQERDKLRIDHPLNDYLGAAKVHSPMWNSADATVRRVLSHTGGLTTFTRWCLPGDPAMRHR